MIRDTRFFVLTAVGGLALALAAADGALRVLAHERQAALVRDQQFVQQTAPLEALYRDMVRSLAENGVRTGDRQTIDMLAAHGLNVTVDPKAARGDTR